MIATQLASTALHAWIDESMIQRPHRAGFYCIAAALADPATCETTREDLLGLRSRANSKLHWREEREPRRRVIVATAAALDVATVVVVVARLDHHRQERARRIAMEVLLPHLAEVGVTEAWLESRTSSLNRIDVATVEYLRGSRRLPATLRVDVAQPSTEPMLWLPDIVAGATMAAELGEPQYLAELQHMVTRIDVVAR